MLFKLPPHLGKESKPLAYVEWFRPLQTADPVSGFFKISRSTRHNRRFATIIKVEDIERACHLSAFALRRIDPAWTSTNVLDRAQFFLLNHYIGIDHFASAFT